MDNITKSLAQAYRSMYEAKGVERASWVPESIADEDVSHFMGAAAAASKAGKSHFEFGGKKYKVTMKKDAAKKISEAEEACDDCGKVHEGSCNEDVKESTEELDEVSLGLATKTYAARKSKAQQAAHTGNKTYAKSQMAKAKKTKSFIQKREETEVEESTMSTPAGRKQAAADAVAHHKVMVKKWGANHPATKDAKKAADHHTKLAMKESPEQPRAKGEKDFKDMHKVTMGADEDELHKKDMEAIKKSVDAIKKKPQPKGNA